MVRVHIANGILTGTAIFAQLTAETLYTLQWAALPPQIAPVHREIWIPCNTWFPGPTYPASQTASWLVQLFLQGSWPWQTDRPTDRQKDHATWSVTTGRIYIHSTATQPDNTGERWVSPGWGGGWVVTAAPVCCAGNCCVLFVIVSCTISPSTNDDLGSPTISITTCPCTTDVSTTHHIIISNNICYGAKQPELSSASHN